MAMNGNSSATRKSAHTVWKRWAIGVTSVLCAATIVGGAAFSASATTPTPYSSPSSTVSHHTGMKAKSAHKNGHELREELRTVIKNGKNAGDMAAAVAITIVDGHAKFAASLPAALHSDLKALAAAPASERAADAAKIKTGAIGGAYGSKIQTAAKNIQSKPDKHSATTK
ncbi:MAG: hypothetical protein ACYCZY_04810 [Lacisediminihabitans sp.]